MDYLVFDRGADMCSAQLLLATIMILIKLYLYVLEIYSTIIRLPSFFIYQINH